MTTRRSATDVLTARRGFTLIELMITVLLSAIVIGGVYALYTVSVKGYRTQDHAIEAQSNLRRALHQLRVDLRSAAFNAPAQSNEEPWVEVLGVNTAMVGVQIEPDPAVPVHEESTNANVAPQQITLLGAYDSQEVFRTVRIDDRRVVIECCDDTWTAADFDRVFNTRNLARLEFYGMAKTEQFIPIASVTAYNSSRPTQEFFLKESPRDVDKIGLGAGHDVSVLGFVRYRLQQDTRRNDESAKYNLIRERVDPAGTPYDRTWLPVAEYVVDLQVYDLCFNEANPIGDSTLTNVVALQCYPTLAAAQAAGKDLGAGATNNSHQLRSVKVKVATRAPFEDPNLPFAPRGSVDEPMRSFDVTTNIFGAARVFEGTATVFMTSIQARRP